MRRSLFSGLGALFCVALGYSLVWAATLSQVLAPGDTIALSCSTVLVGSVGGTASTVACATPTTGTTPHPGYHPPGTHDGLNVHEHGDALPSWVLASSQQPFTQTRESHTGYKGVYARDRGGKGVESYVITHILSTETARSHGDHDYQVWFRHPNGAVLAQQGLLDFSSQANLITAPIPERTTDTGERPIALSVGDGGCETWYSRPGRLIFDLGWTICGRYQKFDGTVSGGVGTFRTMDWVLPADRLAADSPFRSVCTVEFGICRISFLVNSKDYAAAGIAPIN